MGCWMKFSLCVKDLHGLIDKVNHMHNGYTSYFVTKTRSVAKQSFQYLQGKLLGKGRGNMCTYAKDVPDCNNQSLQHLFQIHHGIIDQFLITFNVMSLTQLETETMVQYMLMNVVFQNKERTQ